MHAFVAAFAGAVFILTSNICFAEPITTKGGAPNRPHMGKRTPPSSANPQLPSRSGISPRLDQIQPNREPASPGGPPTEREKENLPVPLPERRGQAHGPAMSTSAPGSPPPLTASVVSKFDGVRQGINYKPKLGMSPPDPNGSVDAKWYVQWVNNVYTIINKTNGMMRVRPTPGNEIWRGFGGNCEMNNDGDPIVIYDRAARHWLMTQFATHPKTSKPHYSECIAVSETDDPGGHYFLFEYEFKQFNDYPKFGIWRDGYYVSFNMFTDANNPQWVGARVCAFDRDKMLSGEKTVRDAARMKCFDPKDESHNAVGGVLPADVDGSPKGRRNT